MTGKLIFDTKKPIIGVVRLLPLPGYPDFPGTNKIVETAMADIKNLEMAGFHGALVDNHAHPHVVKGTEEMVAGFVEVMEKLTEKMNIPLGVQFLIDDPEAAITIAKASGAKFIRTDFFVDRVKTEYGIMEPRAREIVAFRKKLGAERVLIWADVQVKHAQMLERKPITVSVAQALRAGADGVIVTGAWTGVAPEMDKLTKAKRAAGQAKVLIGSGLTKENSGQLLGVADGALVGTAIRNGSRIDLVKAQELMATVNGGSYVD